MSIVRARTQLTKSLEQAKTEYAAIQAKADERKSIEKAKIEKLVIALEALDAMDAPATAND